MAVVIVASLVVAMCGCAAVYIRHLVRRRRLVKERNTTAMDVPVIDDVRIHALVYEDDQGAEQSALTSGPADQRGTRTNPVDLVVSTSDDNECSLVLRF